LPTRSLLDNVRILDLTHVLAGPFCTMILADLGAEVFKVEHPQTGDQVRTIPPFVGGQSHYFLATNRNKKSFACDLKNEAARELVAKLAERCDVVVDNFRPGVTGRLGLDHDTLSRANPKVITCSITGFGSEGPWKDRPSFDLVNQAMSGIMSVTGEADGPPVKTGVPIGDLGGGLWAAIAILAALNRRAVQGEGARLEISLMDGLLGLLGYLGQLALLTKQNPPRVGSGHHSIVPYGRYATSDGELVLALHVGDFWRRFAAAAGLEELIHDSRFATTAARREHRDELEPIVRRVMRSRPNAEWEELLSAAGVPHGPILGVYEALTSEFVQQSGILANMEHPTAGSVDVVSSPVRVDGVHAVGRDGCLNPSPLLGGDTVDILREVLGVDDKRIAELEEDGAIRTNDRAESASAVGPAGAEL
jgi:crotonobetainyl-CoA:carnitine CoA-transferase CaiB-like acyl-CoA transferase